MEFEPVPPIEGLPEAPPVPVCLRCGAALAPGRRFPVLAPALALAGCLLAFYLVGFALIAAAAWLWTRRGGPLRCPRCAST